MKSSLELPNITYVRVLCIEFIDLKRNNNNMNISQNVRYFLLFCLLILAVFFFLRQYTSKAYLLNTHTWLCLYVYMQSMQQFGAFKCTASYYQTRNEYNVCIGDVCHCYFLHHNSYQYIILYSYLHPFTWNIKRKFLFMYVLFAHFYYNEPTLYASSVQTMQ